MSGQDHAARITAELRRDPDRLTDSGYGIFQHGGIASVLAQPVTGQRNNEAFRSQSARDECVIIRVAPAPAAAMNKKDDRQGLVVVGFRRRVNSQLLVSVRAILGVRNKRDAPAATCKPVDAIQHCGTVRAYGQQQQAAGQQQEQNDAETDLHRALHAFRFFVASTVSTIAFASPSPRRPMEARNS